MKWKRQKVGFDKSESTEYKVNDGSMRAALRRHPSFSPEFIDRVDHILVFSQLEIRNLESIARTYLSDKSMVFFANNGINIAFDRNVFEYIAKLSAKGRESARGLHRKCDTAFGCAVDFAVQNPKQSRQNGIYVKMMGNAIVANVPQSFTRRQLKAIQKHSAFLKS